MAGDEENVSQRVLNYAQVYHLQHVVANVLRIDARGSNPTLTMTASELIEAVRYRLNLAGIPVKDIRINGSAASCVVACEAGRTYNDLDVLFNLRSEGTREDHTRHDRIRSAALSALLDFFPDDCSSKKHLSTEVLSESYIHKMVKIDDSVSRWSLISLKNNSGCNIELKFVDSMKRKYQFSIDSFQVVIDSLLLYEEASPIKMNERFFPTVVAQTFYGNFDDALEHLKEKLIATHNPEEIRGGGLLKYCSLLACGYSPAKGVNTHTLEKYMCARFFIDFPTIELQRVQLHNYLENHFVGKDDRKGLFLVLTLNVVQRSAFCLPAHEREQTLMLIHQMAIGVTFAPRFRAFSKQREMNLFDAMSSDRPHSFPSFPPVLSVRPFPGTLPMPPNCISNETHPPLMLCPVYYSSNPVIIQNGNCYL